jgi:hypothetical protein
VLKGTSAEEFREEGGGGGGGEGKGGMWRVWMTAANLECSKSLIGLILVLAFYHSLLVLFFNLIF